MFPLQFVNDMYSWLMTFLILVNKVSVLEYFQSDVILSIIMCYVLLRLTGVEPWFSCKILVTSFKKGTHEELLDKSQKKT